MGHCGIRKANSPHFQDGGERGVPMTTSGQTGQKSRFSVRAALVAATLVVAGCFTAAFTFASGEKANAQSADSKVDSTKMVEVSAP